MAQWRENRGEENGKRKNEGERMEYGRLRMRESKTTRGSERRFTNKTLNLHLKNM